MESASFDWISYGITFILGSLIGALLTFWLKPANKKSRQLEKQLEENEHKQTKYKEQVSNHFAQTAELVADLTHQYKKVYDHLSTSAQSLCPDEVITQQLTLSDPEGSLEKSNNDLNSHNQSSHNQSSNSQPSNELTNGEFNNEFSDTSNNKNHDKSHKKQEDDVNYEMPKDYASTSDSQSQGGTLSEDYGLQSKRDSCLDKEDTP